VQWVVLDPGLLVHRGAPGLTTRRY